MTDESDEAGEIGASDASEPSEATASKLTRWRHRPKRRRTWRFRVVIGLVVVVALILGLVGSEAIYLAYRNHQIKRIKVAHLVPPAPKGPDVGTQTFLMIGSTSRCALKQQSQAFGTCAEGVTGVNSDVILLLRADQNTHTVSILSIPRDMVLENVRDDSQKFYKVDAALADGPGQLVNVIEQDFGIPINHFVELNFDSFQNVVTALGGIDMYFPYPERDNYSSLDIKKAGCQHLNGFEALAVVRARHLSYQVKGGHWDYDGTGDLGRIIRVHEFLKVLAAAMEKRGLDNVLTDNDIIGAIAPQLTVDSGLSLSDMVDLVRVFHGTSPSAVPETTLPNIEDTQDYLWNGIDFGSVVLPSYPQDQAAIDKFEGLKKPPGSNIAPSSISLSVENGTLSPDSATTVASKLSSKGFHVVGTGTTTPVGSIAEAVVYYRPGHQYDAERVAETLDGIVSIAQGPTLDRADVMLVTGTNFSLRRPGKKHHSSGSSNPYPILTKVSSAAQPLPPYDPRACPSS